MVLYASTFPMTCNSTGTSFCEALATTTGTSPKPFLPADFSAAVGAPFPVQPVKRREAKARAPRPRTIHME